MARVISAWIFHHGKILACAPFGAVDVPADFNMGMFRHGDFLARGLFSTGTFRHMNISASWMFRDISSCAHFDTGT